VKTKMVKVSPGTLRYFDSIQVAFINGMGFGIATKIDSRGALAACV
jgi:hypothetical protein